METSYYRQSESLAIPVAGRPSWRRQSARRRTHDRMICEYPERTVSSQRTLRIADISQLIPPPAPDLTPLRSQFTRAVDSLREQYAAGLDRGSTRVRFVAGMYAAAATRCCW
jgi:hypothetical protein